MKVVGEKTFLGENITTPDEFITDLCERIDGAYRITMEVESRAGQLACIMGFIRGFKGRLNRVCDNIYNSKSSKERGSNLEIAGEETFFGQKINTPEDCIKDFRNIVNTVYDSAMEEEEEMPRLAYLIGAMIGLKSRLNRICGTI